MKTAILFPAFVSEYSGAEPEFLVRYPNHFRSLLERASEVVDTDLTGFDFNADNYLGEELKSQYISYIYSCAVADVLRREKVIPGHVTAYSMGLYSALYYCGSAGFSDGLVLVRKAWEAIQDTLPQSDYAMGMVIGLSRDDVNALMAGGGKVWVCNRNSPHTFILSGERSGIDRILEAARAEGALRTSLLPASRPYHTPLLQPASRQLASIVDLLPLRNPEYPYLSSLTQKVITDAEGLKKEIVDNLAHDMDWYATMVSLTENGVEAFLECGAGDGLTRNFRFIGGAERAHSIAKLASFLEGIR